MFHVAIYNFKEDMVLFPISSCTCLIKYPHHRPECGSCAADLGRGTSTLLPPLVISSYDRRHLKRTGKYLCCDQAKPSILPPFPTETPSGGVLGSDGRYQGTGFDKQEAPIGITSSSTGDILRSSRKWPLTSPPTPLPQEAHRHLLQHPDHYMKTRFR